MAPQSEQYLVALRAPARGAGGGGGRAVAPWSCGDLVVTADAPDVAAIVRVLSDGNVQFVVVGDVEARGPGVPLLLVVSRHPTNLEALGRALDRLDSTVRVPLHAEAAEEEAEKADGMPLRVGDPRGTIGITTSAGDVDLMFGAANRSLYAELASRAEVRELGDLRVQWTGDVPDDPAAVRPTGRKIGRRLLSLAEGFAHLMERQREEPEDCDERSETLEPDG